MRGRLHQGEAGGATGQSRRRGEAVVEDVTTTIEYEKASPKLQEKCLKGEVIPDPKIEASQGFGIPEAMELEANQQIMYPEQKEEEE